MRELPWPALFIHKQDSRVRKLRFGHDGYAQFADRPESDNRGVAGDSEASDEVSDAGVTGDFNGILMGLGNAESEVSDEVEDDGDSDAENIVFRVSEF